MKYNHLKLLAIANTLILTPLYSQTSIVGAGSSYNDLFPASSPVTYDVPGGEVDASVTLSNGSNTESRGLWALTAQGGANATIAASLTESAAQVTLTGSSMVFGITNDSSSLLGLLDVGTSIHYGWQAVAYFNTPDILNYTPNTRYSVSFDVDGNNGLLSSVAGLNPSFSFELIDGLGNTLSSSNSDTLINIAGLLGTGVPTGTVSLDYLVDGTAPSGPIGVRFIGDATVGAAALGLGTDFATISNLNITTTPVPEPGGSVLIASVGLLLLLRRRRIGPS